MRGAVTFGTAEKADLDSLPVYVIGKTGTSTPLQGFRSQGWFVGVVFESNTRYEPANAQLVVVVYLRKAHGFNAAEVARVIFAEFTGAQSNKRNNLRLRASSRKKLDQEVAVGRLPRSGGLE